MNSGLYWSDEHVRETYVTKVCVAMASQFEEDGGLIFDRQILNTRPDAIDHRDLFYKPRLTEVPSFNYAETIRDADFEVRRQGSEGSCTGQALAAVIDLQNIKRFREGAPVPKHVSARMAYESAKLYDHFPEDGLEGSSIRGAIKGFYHRGICDELLAPYEEYDSSFQYNEEINKNSNSVVLGAYFRLQHVLNHYHTAISEAGAILCSAMIHRGWERKYVRQNQGYIALPSANRKTRSNLDSVALLGGHAFAIVGYDDKGFLVLNSWGSSWGGFNPVKAHIDSLEADSKRVKINGNFVENTKLVGSDEAFEVNGTLDKIRGLAHWSYDDWSRHVLDAWVLRLAAPTRKQAWYSGGFSHEGEMAVKSVTPRSRNVVGHFIHVTDGRYVEEPPYDNSVQTIKTTANIIRKRRGSKKSKAQYKHLVFYAHGALDTIDHASARAAAMTPIFKRNGIYPMFYFWRTGIGTIASEIIKSQLAEVEARSQGKQNIINHLLERQIETVGRAIWRDVKRNAQDCFSCVESCPLQFKNREDCQLKEGCIAAKGWEAAKLLIESAIKDNMDTGKSPMKIHYIAHSAGVLMLGHLLKKLQDHDKAGWSKCVDSVTLMAPACTNSFFLEHFETVAAQLGKRFMLLNLPSSVDTAMDPHLQPYGKSLLHLASNAFEDQRGSPIAGLDIFWPDTALAQNEFSDDDKRLAQLKTNIDYKVVDKKITDQLVQHMDFDNNAEIMNFVLKHILNRKSKVKNGFDPELLRNGKF